VRIAIPVDSERGNNPGVTPTQNPSLDPGQISDPAPPPPAAPVEDPPWTGWDVLRIAFLAVFSIIVCLFVVTFAVRRLVYPNVPWRDVAQYPVPIVFAQLVAYVLVLVFMYATVHQHGGKQFWKTIGWNWPDNWALFVISGVVLSVGLQAIANLLPMPKNLPIDRFFQTAREAYLLSIFGMTVAPLLEELFFRGFLYPVLARRLGMVTAVGLTALSFGLIHAPQLGRAWGPVLVIFLVGVALTVTRAVTKSVAAGVLMHMAYNATISVLIFFATDHFRHLEKLKQ